MKTAAIVLAALVVLCCLGGCPAKVQQPLPPSPAVTPPITATPAPAGETTPAGKSATVGKTATAGLALGKQIFTTGLGRNGQHLAFTGGSDRFKAKPGGCINCHGADGRGKKLPKLTIPDIRYSVLRGGTQIKYASDSAVLGAIRNGKDERGQPLENMMPQWQLGDAESTALIEQLKALDKAPAAKAKPAKAEPAKTSPVGAAPAVPKS